LNGVEQRLRPKAETETYDPLGSTQEFWDSNPCGLHSGYLARREQRYSMEPWVPEVLAKIASRHKRILEVGCGQGVDAMFLCSALAAGATYVGVDYSDASIAVAQATAGDLGDTLNVRPTFQQGNAERLAFPDESFDAVYSMGVLHHTANERAALDEIHRILGPGGRAYIFLYRTLSPKLVVAKALRMVQKGLDAVLRTDRCLYRLLRRYASDVPVFGTMFHECFGVPYLKSYSRKEMDRLFERFAVVELHPVGSNIGRFSWNPSATSAWGYFWHVEVEKR
jgi:ubiquinone/menaquinone biosynthesis C-methylase UbiE